MYRPGMIQAGPVVKVLSVLLVPVLGIVLTSGCVSQTDRSSSLLAGSGDVTDAMRPSPGGLAPEDNPFLVRLAPGGPVVVPGISRKAVQFRVIQVQAPLGEFSRSQKIWDHLDEQAVGTETQMVLQRNGLRVAIGTPESWPPVKAILDTIAKRTVRQLPPSMPNSLSVTLQLTGKPVDQTVFFYRPDGTMAGNYYTEATDVLRITWDFYTDNIEQVVVYVTPEIRQEKKGLAFQATLLGAAPVPIYGGKVFDELACRLVVSPGGYIVIGPGPDVYHAGLLGKEFLVTQIDGEPYESMLVIVPEMLDLSQQADGIDQKATVSGK